MEDGETDREGQREKDGARERVKDGERSQGEERDSERVTDSHKKEPQAEASDTVFFHSLHTLCMVSKTLMLVWLQDIVSFCPLTFRIGSKVQDLQRPSFKFGDKIIKIIANEIILLLHCLTVVINSRFTIFWKKINK